MSSWHPFGHPEEAPDQLSEIKAVQETADAMKEYFDANPAVGIPVNGRSGHVVTYRSADKEVTAFIPRSKA